MMKKILSVWKEIAVFILLIAAVILLAVFGKTDTVSKGCEIEKYASEEIGEENLLTGTVTPAYKQLQLLSFFINRADQNAPGNIMVTLYDAEGNVSGECERPLAEMTLGYMNAFPLNCSVVPGEEYSYEICVKDCGDFPITVDLASVSASIPESGSSFMAGKELGNAAPLMELTYRTHMQLYDMLPYLLVIFLIGIVLLFAVEDKKNFKLAAKIGIYVLFLLSVTTLLLMNDEGKKPLIMTGTEMTHETGGEDYRGYLTVDASSGFSGLLSSSKEYMLQKDQYTLQLSYLSDMTGNTLEVYQDNEKVQMFELMPENTYAAFGFTLKQDAQNVEFRIYYDGVGTLKINQLSLLPEHAFYTDNLFFLILFLLINAGCILLYIRNKKKPIAKETLFDVSIMLLLTVFATMPFYTTAMSGADDQCYHLLRIEGLKDAIMDGQFPAVIMPNALSGNGYLNSMYPYLFLYLPALLRICGVSLVLSYKFLVFVMNAATILTAYYSIKTVSKSRYAALLGGALYLLLPYRYTNIYARGALGEMLAMTFIPLLLAGFYHLLFGNHKKWILLVIGFSGVLQSHVLSFVIMCIFAVLSCVIFIRELFSEKRIFSLMKAAVVTIGLNLWFVVPFVWFYLKGNLGAEALGWSNYLEYAINPSSFADTLHLSDYRYLSFGIPVLCCFAFCLLHILFTHGEKQKENKGEHYFRLLFVFSCIMTVMITGYSAAGRLMEWSPLEKLFKLIQFPWRLFAPVSAMVIFTAVIWLADCKWIAQKQMKWTIMAALIGISLFAGLSTPADNNNFAFYQESDTYSTGHEIKLRGIQPSQATIRYPFEWRINCVGDDALMTVPYPTDYENTEILSYEKQGTQTVLTYKAEGKDSMVILPIMNYYGYHAYDENGVEIPITLESGYAVGTALNGDGNTHQIVVKYEMPVLFTAAGWLSVLSIIGFVFGTVIIRKNLLSFILRRKKA